jgi:murein DD-endopeptidase MepM/ murein hydrolase activator NlpD
LNAGDRRAPGNGRAALAITLAAGLGTACLAIAPAAPAGASGGGINVGPSPAVRDVTCAKRCLDVRTVAERGRITLTGSNLGDVVEVRFPGRHGNLAVKPASVSGKSVSAEVPKGAKSGKPSVVDDYGARDASPVKLEVEPEDSVTEVDGFKVTRAEATPKNTYFDGRHESSVSYLFKAKGPADIRVDVISARGGEVIDSIVKRHQKPFANHSAAWDGHMHGGRIAPDGDYRFRVSQLSGGHGAAAGFSLHGHIFPLRGKHEYGDGLGGGRGHQGQDVFAKCGTKIVAARGGRVQTADYQSAAGYYVVIDGVKTGNDYMYAHMEKRGRPADGSRVHTGEVIGYESDTGDASGCHLHFELWSAPGWYEGGHVLNPTKALKKWDKYS